MVPCRTMPGQQNREKLFSTPSIPIRWHAQREAPDKNAFDANRKLANMPPSSPLYVVARLPHSRRLPPSAWDFISHDISVPQMCRFRSRLLRCRRRDRKGTPPYNCRFPHAEALVIRSLTAPAIVRQENDTAILVRYWEWSPV